MGIEHIFCKLIETFTEFFFVFKFSGFSVDTRVRKPRNLRGSTEISENLEKTTNLRGYFDQLLLDLCNIRGFPWI